jgi:transposase
MEFKHYIGIDVSKSTLDFAVCVDGKIIAQYQSENNKKAIVQVVKQLRRLNDFGMTSSVFCMEFTGIYNNHLLDYLLSCKSAIWMESAIQIKQSQGMIRGKNDAIDAIRIAQYAFTFRNKAKLWTAPREALKTLRAMISMRDRLVNSIKELSVPVKENADFVSKEIRAFETKIIKNTVSQLQHSVEKIDRQIEELINNDSHLKEMYKLLTSITGVGPIVAINLIVATEEFKKFDQPQKFACYSGVVPFANRSGTSVKGRWKVSHLANKKIKTLLHLAAMAALNAKGELKEYYLRKVAEGKNKMSVINAIRNKIIHRIFAIIKRQTPYEKKYQTTIV